jgi:hypothetical protein
VAVLLSDPRARPLAPRRRRRARLVAHAVERVDHRHVRRQRLLRDHVADQRDVVGVRELARALAQLADLLEKVGRGGVGEEVLRLPALLDGLEDGQHALGGEGVERADELEALGADGVDLAHRDEDDGRGRGRRGGGDGAARSGGARRGRGAAGRRARGAGARAGAGLLHLGGGLRRARRRRSARGRGHVETGDGASERCADAVARAAVDHRSRSLEARRRRQAATECGKKAIAGSALPGGLPLPGATALAQVSRRIWGSLEPSAEAGTHPWRSNALISTTTTATARFRGAVAAAGRGLWRPRVGQVLEGVIRVPAASGRLLLRWPRAEATSLKPSCPAAS